MIGRLQSRFVNRDHDLLAYCRGWWKVLPHTSGGAHLVDILWPGKQLLTRNGGATWQGPSHPGGRGSVLFDGSSGYTSANVPRSFNPGTGSFSLAFWFKGANAAVYGSLMVQDNTGGTGSGQVWGITQGNFETGVAAQYLGFGVYSFVSSETSQVVHTNVTVDDGTWHHVVAAANASTKTWTAYVDGASVGVTSDHSSASWPDMTGCNTSPWETCLQHGTSNTFLACSLDDIMYWKGQVLSSSEAYALYRESRAGCTNLIPRRRWWRVNAPSGGTGYSVSLSDKIALTDSASTASSFYRSLTDNLAVIDSSQRKTAVSRALPDNLALTDTTSRVTYVVRLLTDNLALTDIISRMVASSRQSTDSTGTTDSASRTTYAVRLLTDSLALSDSVTRATSALRTLTDAIGITDTASRIAAALRVLSDNLALKDTTTILGPGGHGHLVSVMDSLGLSDTAQTMSALLRLLTDTFALSDSVNRLSASKRIASDTAAVTDVSTRSTGSARALTDNAGLTDIAKQATGWARLLADSAGATDSIKFASTIMRAITDSFGQSDTSQTRTSSLRVFSDNVGVSDMVARAVSTLLKLADMLGLTDRGILTKIIIPLPTMFLTGAAQRNVAPTATSQRNVFLTGARLGP